ncbi:MAG: YidH family protein [Bacteroidales bacterium]
MNDNHDVGASVMDTPPPDPRVGLAKNRTSFAKFRTQLALDRTTLAWIRTALTMATFGFGTVGFFRSLRETSPTPESVQLHASAIRFGVGLIVLGIAATVLSGVAHWRALRRLRRDEVPALSRWSLSITIALLLAIVGLVSLWDLLGGV